MNRVTLSGNIVRDIEMRYTPSNVAVATTGIACNKKYKKADGSQGEEVMFIDVTFFKRSAEIAQQYLTKGSKILLEGSLKLDTWDDKNGGGKRSKHSVVVESFEMIGAKSEEKPKSAPKVETYDTQGNKTAEYDFPTIDVNDDEIPF